MSTATATANAPAGSMKNSKRITKGLTYLALTLGSIIMIFPFVWMVLTCFKTQAESMAIPPQILPSQWNFDNFVTALESLPFVNLYINTALLIVLRAGLPRHRVCLRHLLPAAVVPGHPQ